MIFLGFPGCSVVRNTSANPGIADSFLRSGRSPGKGNGNPPQYSCLGNPMDRGDWLAVVHGVAKEIPLSSKHTSEKYNISPSLSDLFSMTISV